MRTVRDFFNENGYLEVETPLLSPYLIPEPAIEVFATEYCHPYESGFPMYLIPSPELWMKRLISMGFGNVFQICKCFRNCESIGRIHNPEFSMLEWYSIDSDYMDEIPVLERLVSRLCDSVSEEPDESVVPPFLRISMKDAFREYTGLDLDLLFDETELKEALRVNGLQYEETDTWEESFNRLFLTHIEPKIPAASPVVLYDYPRGIPTLAKRRNGHYYERWELYMNGIEIANCYTEETDEVRLREFVNEEALRKNRGRIGHEIDRDFSALFHDGFPRCSGTALGIDRLFMCMNRIPSIEEALLFPFNRITQRNRKPDI